MSILQSSKVTDWKNVMNMLDGLHFAFLANSSRPFHDFLFGLFPSNSIRPRATAFPSWMCIPNSELRLPFSHAGTRAKWFLGVEVGGRPTKIIHALHASFRNSIAAAWIWLSYLTRHATEERAELLASLPGTTGRLSTGGAYRLNSIAPSIQQVAITGTERLILSAIVWMKCVAALGAIARFIGSHVTIIARIEERYCEIAVKRLAQTVLPL